MKFSVFSNLVRHLKGLSDKREAYIDRVPGDLSITLCENEYAQCTSFMFEALFHEVFGEDLSLDVEYFLFEEYPHRIIVDDIEYMINDVDEYLAYAEKNFKFDAE